MTTVDKHEYFKMIRAREERIRTFMQLELDACLEEGSWTTRSTIKGVGDVTNLSPF